MWLSFVAAVSAAPAVVNLTAPTGEIGAHDAITLTFTAPPGTFIDGCAPVEWERREGTAWVPVARVPCPAQKPATKVDSALTLAMPPLPPGEYRAVISWGSGCAEELPLQLGACTTLDFVRSAAFRVRPPTP